MSTRPSTPDCVYHLPSALLEESNDNPLQDDFVLRDFVIIRPFASLATQDGSFHRLNNKQIVTKIVSRLMASMEDAPSETWEQLAHELVLRGSWARENVPLVSSVVAGIVYSTQLAAELRSAFKAAIGKSILHRVEEYWHVPLLEPSSTPPSRAPCASFDGAEASVSLLGHAVRFSLLPSDTLAVQRTLEAIFGRSDSCIASPALHALVEGCGNKLCNGENRGWMERFAGVLGVKDAQGSFVWARGSESANAIVDFVISSIEVGIAQHEVNAMEASGLTFPRPQPKKTYYNKRKTPPSDAAGPSKPTKKPTTQKPKKSTAKQEKKGKVKIEAAAKANVKVKVQGQKKKAWKTSQRKEYVPSWDRRPMVPQSPSKVVAVTA